ncbi:PREDICTED: androgen-dependent TFPI-regulating protein [Elephantulus edwardii]|uniref:androgen-dependent TFPI-regulating protein n=1 Tax=Elephantulus edwardii TaxID=28737 RepID=UPI0003F080D4|nr:PREDICTED: androgen-dependent TFPI-regulating protein [Elephantulus edwardii]
MAKTSTCIYHFLVTSWYIFLCNYILQCQNDPPKAKIFENGGLSKYLTFLNLFLQAIFFGIASLDDVLKRITRKKDIPFLTAFRDLLFITLAFPLSTLVFGFFWTIYLYDRELIYPKAVDDIFPEWLNHAMHTSILPLVLAEFFIRPHYSPLKKKGVSIILGVGVAYSARILWIYHETGTWVYPVFAQLSPLGIAVFFSLSYMCGCIVALLGEKFNHLIWGFVFLLDPQFPKGEDYLSHL